MQPCATQLGVDHEQPIQIRFQLWCQQRLHPRERLGFSGLPSGGDPLGQPHRARADHSGTAQMLAGEAEQQTG